MERMGLFSVIIMWFGAIYIVDYFSGGELRVVGSV
jgi:hypothetical protein